MDYNEYKNGIKNAIVKYPNDMQPYIDMIALFKNMIKNGWVKVAINWNEAFRPTIDKNLFRATKEGRMELANLLYKAKYESLLLSAPYRFDAYLQAVEYHKPLNKQFYQPRKTYLKRYVDAYQGIIDGEVDFLSISMPKRALSNDTLVLTTNGFKKHGDLVVGDYVYGIDGRPKKVQYIHPKTNIDYKVEFSNGETVYCNGEHVWYVWDRGTQKDRNLTTEEIIGIGLKNVNRWRMLLPMCEDIDGEDANLPIDPYCFGAWLGDGTTCKPYMTNDKNDLAIIEKTSKRYPIQNQYVDKNYGTIVTVFGKELTEALRKVGLCYRESKGNKYIPDVYLTASRKQRLELLAGLIDTDGFTEQKKHRVQFSTVLPALRDGVIALASSFGWDVRCVTTQPKTSTSGVVGRHEIYKITFVPDCELPLVLERKKNIPADKPRRISIRAITKLDTPIEGNCITVEGGLYRVGLRQVITHNCGKSQLGINFTAMISGKYPERSTLMEGVGDDLVNSFYKGVLEYIREPNEYNYHDIFPEATLVETNADLKTMNLKTVNRFPTVMCRAIDSSQVGLSEATNLLYLDDCVAGIKESRNRDLLDKKWETIRGDIVGRAIEGTPIVICGTRYSIYDPIGHLQDEMKQQGKRVVILETPALDFSTDESNFEFVRDGKHVFTTKYFRDQRKMLSPEQFESEFQQKPFEAKGLLFPKDKMHYFKKLPVDQEPDAIVAVCDTAESGSDFTSMPIAAVYGDEVFIIDVVFDDAAPNVTIPEIATRLMEKKVSQVLFESNNAGSYFAKDVKGIIDKNGGYCDVRTQRTVSNKQTRMEVASPNILNHFYFLDSSEYETGSQYYDFMRQVWTYTRQGKVPHDDAPDSLSILVNFLRNLKNGKITVFKRPF